MRGLSFLANGSDVRSGPDESYYYVAERYMADFVPTLLLLALTGLLVLEDIATSVEPNARFRLWLPSLHAQRSQPGYSRALTTTKET